MTLVVSAVLPRAVVHVSDRLVTKKRRAVYMPHDAHSNKTIIVVAEHCWLVMGYTGQAYFGTRTTDQHLASAISNTDLQGDTTAGPRFETRGVDYREVIRRVAEALRPAAVETTVTIAGYFNVRDFARQLLVDIRASGGGRVDVRQRLKARPQAVHYNRLHPIGWVDADVRRRLATIPWSQDVDGPEELRERLVAVVMGVGGRDIPVGEDTMSVVLHPYEGRGEIKFRTASPVTQADIASRSIGEPYGGYSGLCAPYILIGGVGVTEPVVATTNYSMGARFGSTTHAHFDISGFDSSPPSGGYIAPQFRAPPP